MAIVLVVEAHETTGGVDAVGAVHKVLRTGPIGPIPIGFAVDINISIAIKIIPITGPIRSYTGKFCNSWESASDGFAGVAGWIG